MEEEECEMTVRKQDIRGREEGKKEILCDFKSSICLKCDDLIEKFDI